MPLCSAEHTQVYFVLRKQRLWAAIVQLDTLFSFLCTLGDTYYVRFLENLDSSIVKFTSYTFRDSLNRLTKFGSQQSEPKNSVHESSYVHLKTRHSSHTFGRIQFIFNHTLDSETHTLACVHWFEDAVVDSVSGLFHVNTNTRNTSVQEIVYLAHLSNPLIHATDEADAHKLWILNHTKQ